MKKIIHFKICIDGQEVVAKKCSKCFKPKPLETGFHLNSAHWDRRLSACKTCHNRIIKQLYTSRGGYKKGEDHRNSKLTEAAVLDIRQSPESRKSMAEKYHVSIWSIHNVINGRTWKHVKETS